jgi:hypothetical protein
MSATRRLKTARKTKTKMAQAFAALKSGELTIYQVLDDPSHVLGRCSVFDVLRRTKGLGETGAEHVLKEAHVWPLKKVSTLSQHEMKILKSALPDRVLRFPLNSHRK